MQKKKARKILRNNKWGEHDEHSKKKGVEKSIALKGESQK